MVGIIAILLAMLFPALNFARFQAHVTECAANEPQFVAAMTSYATDFNDYFPRFDAPATELTGADNPHDVTYEFYSYLMGHYNQPQSSFYCPFTDESITSIGWGPGGFVEIGYAYWVPRVGNPGSRRTGSNGDMRAATRGVSGKLRPPARFGYFFSANRSTR